MLKGIVLIKRSGRYRVRVTQAGRTQMVDCKTYVEALRYLLEMRISAHQVELEKIDKALAAATATTNNGNNGNNGNNTNNGAAHERRYYLA